MKNPVTHRYILCQYVPLQNGKSNKIPLHPQTLRAHNPLDTAIHMDYASATALAAQCGPSYGVGFVFVAEDKYVFIDIDNCLTAEGTWNEIAMNTLSYYPGAYAEVSHSGRGLHIIARYEGPAPFTGRRLDAQGVEIYTAERFCALTGTNAIGDAQTVHTEGFHRHIAALGVQSEHQGAAGTTEWTTEDAPDTNVPQDNQELLQFIMSRKLTANEAFGTMVEFKHLWEANEDVLSKHFPTQTPGKAYDASAADAALAYRLHYYAGGNCERVLELMNLSNLKRDKWESHPRYLPLTIENTRGKNRKFYKHVRLPQPFVNNNTTALEGAQPEITNRVLCVLNYPNLCERGRKVLDTSINLKLLLDVFGIGVKWNSMKREREITIPRCELFPEDAENNALNIICDIALNNFMPIQRIDAHLDLIAQQNTYHPIVEGLKQTPWDGVPRLTQFIDTLETTNRELTQKLVKRWMVSAIAAAHSKDGFAAQGVLVLAGNQNLGKTRFVKSLDPFNCHAVKGGAILDPKDKDCVKTLAGFWIAELGELDGTFRKADMARLKSFITESSDKFRFAYARKDSILLRRTVYAATVNDPNFLVDDTGNRRWWTIHVLSINSNHGLDMAQVWAEVYYLWAMGEQTWLSNEELSELNTHNKRHEMINPLEESLYSFFDFSGTPREEPPLELSSTEVLKIIGISNPSRSQCTQMGKIIMRATGKNPIRRMRSTVHLLYKK